MSVEDDKEKGGILAAIGEAIKKAKEAAEKKRQTEALGVANGKKKPLEQKSTPPSKEPLLKTPAQRVEELKQADAASPSKVVERKIAEDPEISKALGGITPKDEELAAIVSHWASASPQVRNRKETVESILKDLKAYRYDRSDITPENRSQAAKLVESFEAYHLPPLKTTVYSTEQKMSEFEEKSERLLDSNRPPDANPEVAAIGQKIKDKILQYKELTKQINETYKQDDPFRAKKLEEAVLFVFNPRGEDGTGVLQARMLEMVSKGENKVKYSDIREYIDLLNFAQQDMATVEYARIRWTEINDWPEGPKDRPREPSQKELIFRGLTTSDIEKLRRGEEGEKEWFWNFVQRKENMPRSDWQLSLTEMQQLEEFWQFLRWKYGEKDGLARELTFRTHIDIRPGLHHRLKVMVHEPVDEETALKTLVISPSEYSYLMKVNKYAPRATALYEEATRNLMMRKRQHYFELKNGNPDKGVLNEAERNAILKRYGENLGNLNNDQTLEYFELWKQKQELEYGVMLWAEDIQFNQETWNGLAEDKAKQDSLLAQLKRTEGSKARDSLMKQLREVQLTAGDLEELKHQGLSPLDIETDRLLRLDLKYNLNVSDPSPLDIRNALTAARTYKILTLDVVQISTAAMADIPHTVKGRYRSPAFERMGRIVNPELFQRRFEMGGRIGSRKQAYHTEKIIRKMKDQGKLKNPNPAEVRRIENELAELAKNDRDKEGNPGGNYGRYEDPKVRHVEATIRVLENEQGVSYGEIARAGTIAIGGPFQISTWRMEVAGTEPLVEQYLAMGKSAEHVGLGFQLAANPFKRDKKDIMREMFERMPHLVSQLSPDEAGQIFARHSNVDQRILSEALITAQMKLSHDPNKGYQSREMNLARDADFDATVLPALQGFASKEGPGAYLRNPSTLAEYRQVTKELIELGTLNAKPIEEGGRGWAEKSWPMTLTYSDMDLGQAQFYKMGEQALQRRFAGDMVQAYKTASVLHDFAGASPELFSPNDPIKPLERLYEAIKSMDSYIGRPPAEKIIADQLEEFFEFNESKNRWKYSWIPGFDWAVRNIPALQKYGSDSVEFTGTLGNMWEEKDLLFILNTARDMHFFDQNPDLYYKLVNRFNLGIGFRILAAVREYWWGWPLLSLFSAGKEALDEDKKRAGG